MSIIVTWTAVEDLESWRTGLNTLNESWLLERYVARWCYVHNSLVRVRLGLVGQCSGTEPQIWAPEMRIAACCGILVAADILAVGVYVSFPYVCFWIGRYGSAEEETTACVLSVPRGWSVNGLGCERTTV